MNAERIQRLLVQLGHDGPYFRRTYEKSGLLKAIVSDENKVSPTTVIAQEEGSSFDEARLYRQSDRRERRRWRWTLQLAFAEEVSLEAFEESLCNDPPKLERDAENVRQVRIALVSADYRHPPHQDPKNGTTATLRFEAELSPT